MQSSARAAGARVLSHCGPLLFATRLGHGSVNLAAKQFNTTAKLARAGDAQARGGDLDVGSGPGFFETRVDVGRVDQLVAIARDLTGEPPLPPSSAF